MKAYKVSFEIKGKMLAHDTRLNRENLKMVIEEFDLSHSLGYTGDRSIDTVVKNLKIEKL